MLRRTPATTQSLPQRRRLALVEEYYASGRAGLAYLPFRAHFSIGVAAKFTDKLASAPPI